MSIEEEHENSSNFDAQLIEHCPDLFRDLRKEEGLEYNDLILSIDPILNKEQMLKLKEGSGKSGSFFFFSHDKKFIIKTMKDHELETMMENFLEKYYSHIMTYENSYLARIYGIYTIDIA